MSLGQRKMFEESDKHADRVLVCDHRGFDWALVLVDGNGERQFLYGTQPPRGNPTRFFEAKLENVDEAFRPWFKKMLKPFNRKPEPEHENECAV